MLGRVLGRGSGPGTRDAHPSLRRPARASLSRPARGGRGRCGCSLLSAWDWASESGKQSVDESVSSEKSLEAGATVCGAWCSLRVCGAGARCGHPHPRGPIPGGTLTDLALGVQEESHAARAGVEADGLSAQGRGRRPLGAAAPLAPHLGRAREAGE